MAFGRRKNESDSGADQAAKDAVVQDPPVADDADDADDVDDGYDGGPFDVEDFDNPADAAEARLDLGSVLVPMRRPARSRSS